MAHTIHAAAAAAVLSAAALLSSCDEFFRTSWGAQRDYDAANITVTADNLDVWLDSASGNAALTDALLEKIIARVRGMADGAEKAAFQSAAAELAAAQSGIGAAILAHAGAVVSAEEARSILKDIQSDFDPRGAASLAAVTAESISGWRAGSEPSFARSAYGGAISPGEAAQAVIVLALAVAGEGFDFSGFTGIESFGSTALEVTEAGRVRIKEGARATPEEAALAAYLNVIAADADGKFSASGITVSLCDLLLGAIA